MNKKQKYEAFFIGKGCRHIKDHILQVEWLGFLESDNAPFEIGKCKKCDGIVVKREDCGSYYILKINEIDN